jgi:hypothetical protein
MKEQTVAEFLHISRAYDNVIIDILYEVMVERELPIHIIRLLWNLLKKKKLLFYVGGIEYKSRTGYIGLPQESVLIPLLYSLLGSGVKRFIPAECSRRQKIALEFLVAFLPWQRCMLLNYRYLVTVFHKQGYALRERLEILNKLDSKPNFPTIKNLCTI